MGQTPFDRLESSGHFKLPVYVETCKYTPFADVPVPK